jgi:hypothetical protein
VAVRLEGVSAEALLTDRPRGFFSARKALQRKAFRHPCAILHRRSMNTDLDEIPPAHRPPGYVTLRCVAWTSRGLNGGQHRF